MFIIFQGVTVFVGAIVYICKSCKPRESFVHTQITVARGRSSSLVVVPLFFFAYICGCVDAPCVLRINIYISCSLIYERVEAKIRAGPERYGKGIDMASVLKKHFGSG